MPEQLLMGLDAWGLRAVLETLDRHPGVAGRARAAALVSSGAAGTTQPSGIERLTLTVPTQEAFLRSLASHRPSQAAVGFEPWPPDWSQGPPGDCDDRFRHRDALIAGAATWRRRLRSLTRGLKRVVLVAAPDEPLTAGGLELVAAWLRERDEEDDAPAPAIDLVLGLGGFDVAAAASSARAARLHATLAELDAAALEPASDPFRTRLLVAPPRVERADLAGAAAEALGWLLASGWPAEAQGGRPRFRGRPACWRELSGASVSLDVPHVAAEITRRLGRQVAQGFAGGDRGRLESKAQVARLLAETEAGLGSATAEPVRAIESLARSVSGEATASSRRIDAGLERIDELAAEALTRARRFIQGGTISRVTSGVAQGWLDRQLDWCWQVVLAGHASLEEVAGWWNLFVMELSLGQLESRCSELRRELDALAGRRLDGAPARVRAAARLDELRLRAGLATASLQLDARRELREAVGERVQLILRASRSVAEIPKNLSPAPQGATGPWRAHLPVTADEMHRSLTAEGLGVAGWLGELDHAGGGSGLRGLARPAAELGADLRRHVERRIREFLARHPVGALQGVGDWFARFVEGRPPASAREPAGLPERLRGLSESATFAGADEALVLGGAVPGSPIARAAGDPALLGWLRLGAAWPLGAFAGLGASSRALAEAAAARRLQPRWNGRGAGEPWPGDLAQRLRREWSAGGGAPAGGEEALARLEAAEGETLRAAAAALPSLGAGSAAARHLGLLASWCGWAELEDLSSVERAVQDDKAQGADEATDAELLAVLDEVAAAALPVRKALEVKVAAERVKHLSEAATRFEAARTRARSELAGLERALLDAALGRGLELLAARLSALRGRSELVAALRTKRVAGTGTTRLVVEVANEGDHPATTASLRLLASPRFRTVGADRSELGAMAAGDRRRVEFAVKADGSDRLPFEVEIAWDDLESAGKTARRGFEAELVLEPPPFRRIERNPYIAGPPVRTEAMFFGREDIFRHVTENLAGRYQDNVLILHGQRRTGKSSILYQLERRDLLPEHVAVLLDLQGLGGFDTAGLLYQLARQAGRRLRKTPDLAAAPLPEREEFKQSCYEAFQEYLDELEDLLDDHGRRLLFMIDEFDVLADRVERGGVEPEVFPFLRNLMQHREQVAFLLSGTHELVEMRRDYWSILFSLASYRQVSYLAEKEARSLVEDPLQGELEFDDLVVDSLLHLTAGHPYYLQLTCQNLVNHVNQQARHAWVAPEDLQAVLPEVLESGAGHFEHEWRALRSPLARALLREVAVSDDTGLRRHAAEDLRAAVARAPDRDFETGAEEVREALQLLADAQLLDCAAGGDGWRLQVDLMRRWIRRRKPPLAAGREAAS